MRRATVPPSGQNAWEDVLIEEELDIPSMSFCFPSQLHLVSHLRTLFFFFFYPAKIQKFMEKTDTSSKISVF